MYRQFVCWHRTIKNSMNITEVIVKFRNRSNEVNIKERFAHLNNIQKNFRRVLIIVNSTMAINQAIDSFKQSIWWYFYPAFWKCFRFLSMYDFFFESMLEKLIKNFLTNRFVNSDFVCVCVCVLAIYGRPNIVSKRHTYLRIFCYILRSFLLAYSFYD